MSLSESTAWAEVSTLLTLISVDSVLEENFVGCFSSTFRNRKTSHWERFLPNQADYKRGRVFGTWLHFSLLIVLLRPEW